MPRRGPLFRGSHPRATADRKIRVKTPKMPRIPRKQRRKRSRRPRRDTRSKGESSGPGVRPSPVRSGYKQKGGPPQAAFFARSDRLEPIHNPGVHPHVVLVGDTVEVKTQQIELDGPDSKLPFSEVYAAAE